MVVDVGIPWQSFCIWKLISLQAPEDSSVLSQVLSDGIDWHPSPPPHFVVVVVSGCFLALHLWEHNCTVSMTCRCTQTLSILQVCAVTFIIAILIGNTCIRVQNFFFPPPPPPPVSSGDNNMVLYTCELQCAMRSCCLTVLAHPVDTTVVVWKVK